MVHQRLLWVCRQRDNQRMSWQRVEERTANPRDTHLSTKSMRLTSFGAIENRILAVGLRGPCNGGYGVCHDIRDLFCNWCKIWERDLESRRPHKPLRMEHRQKP